jgi:transposase
MDIHQNARLLPRMRAALAEEILKGRTVRAVAAGYRVSERTARKWVIRFQREGV